MNVGILGTGVVGTALGGKLGQLGHSVMIGGRESTNEKGQAWAESNNAHYGTFAETAAFGELLINATNGNASLEALNMAGADALAGKTLIDLANQLDFSTGRGISHASDQNCLAEQIQQAFPRTNVVKSLNTMNFNIMINPSILAGDHLVFLSGDNAEAKAEVRGLLHEFGWKDHNIMDLGSVVTARGPEMIMPLWLSLWGVIGNTPFNVGVVKAS